MDNIFRKTIETKNKNTIQFFYNKESGLLCVDLVHDNEKGGIELLRKTLNEESLLEHCIDNEPEARG